MRLSKTSVLAALLLASATTRLHADMFYAIECTDLRGNSNFQICTDAEKKKLEAELRSETLVYPKALEETKAEWLTAHPESPFPGGRLKQRTLKVQAESTKREEAEKALKIDESHKERSVAKGKAEEERILNMKATRTRRGNNQAMVEQQKHKVNEERERDSLADRAEEMLRKKLSAAAGHEIAFYGETPSEQKKGAAPDKKKK